MPHGAPPLFASPAVSAARQRAVHTVESFAGSGTHASVPLLQLVSSVQVGAFPHAPAMQLWPPVQSVAASHCTQTIIPGSQNGAPVSPAQSVSGPPSFGMQVT